MCGNAVVTPVVPSARNACPRGDGVLKRVRTFSVLVNSEVTVAISTSKVLWFSFDAAAAAAAVLLLLRGDLALVCHLLGNVVAARIRVRARRRSRRPALRGAAAARRPASVRRSSGCPALAVTGVVVVVSGTSELAQQVEARTARTAQLGEHGTGSQQERDLGNEQSLGGQQHQTAEEEGSESQQLSGNGQNDGLDQLELLQFARSVLHGAANDLGGVLGELDVQRVRADEGLRGIDGQIEETAGLGRVFGRQRGFDLVLGQGLGAAGNRRRWIAVWWRRMENIRYGYFDRPHPTRQRALSLSASDKRCEMKVVHVGRPARQNRIESDAIWMTFFSTNVRASTLASMSGPAARSANTLLQNDAAHNTGFVCTANTVCGAAHLCGSTSDCTRAHTFNASITIMR